MILITKRNSKLVMVGISFTAIIFLGLFTSQALARPQYWPSWDIWRETSPEAQEMDSSKIEEMYDFIETNEINIQSVLIIRNGYIINEEYLNNSIRMEQKSYYWPEADPVCSAIRAWPPLSGTSSRRTAPDAPSPARVRGRPRTY